MDYQNALLTGAISGAIISICGVFYKYFAHSRCRSKCCDKLISFNLDLSPSIESSFTSKPLLEDAVSINTSGN